MPLSEPLRVEGSLTFTVDGPAGASTGTALGDGEVLRVRADDPAAAWDALGGLGSAARPVGRLADRLSAAGLAVQVSGPAGVLATVGAGADSSVGRLVTGSRRVQPGRAAAVGPVVAARVGRTAWRRRGRLLLALAVLLAGHRIRVAQARPSRRAARWARPH